MNAMTVVAFVLLGLLAMCALGVLIGSWLRYRDRP